MITELNEKNFEESIKKGIKLVAFTAQWCGYCKKQKPILDEISNQNIWIGNVDSEENPQIVSFYEIQAFPSFIIFKEGKPIAKFAGFKDKYNLLNTVLSYIK